MSKYPIIISKILPLLFIISSCKSFKVTVYTAKNHKGSSFSFILNGTSDSECVSPLPPLVDSQIMSINTGGGCANLYKTQDCVGEFAALKPGNPAHNDLSVWKGYAKTVRSIGPCFDRCHPKMIENKMKNHALGLYEHPNYKGYHATLNLEPKECLQLSVKMKRKVSSLKAHGEFCVELHHNWDCSGKFMDIRPGSPLHHNLLFWWGNDDKASAVSLCGFNCNNSTTAQNSSKIENHKNENSVILYDEVNWEGNANSIPTNLAKNCFNLTDEWDGQTQSIKLPEHENCLVVYEEFGCINGEFGRNLTLDGSNLNFSRNLQAVKFDGVIQSLKLCPVQQSVAIESNAKRTTSGLSFMGILFTFIFSVCAISIAIIMGILIMRKIRNENTTGFLDLFRKHDPLKELVL